MCRRIALACLALTFLLVAARDVSAARATAPRLLPRDTLFYVRLADVPDAVDRFLQTGMGRMLQDPQIRPLVSDAYGTVKEALGEVQDRLGMSLDDLLSIPQGEIAIGMFRLEGQNTPGMALIVDCGPSIGKARKLFANLKEMAEASGQRRVEQETVADTTVTVFFERNRPREHVFEKDGTFVLCPDLESARAVLTSWTGRQRDAFEDNAKFAAIMRACSPGRDEQPQLTWFVDPLGIADLFAQGNVGARVGLAMLPVLGLDGFNAVGGSIAMAAGEFDMITHIHVLLAIPRSGVLAAVALDSGDLVPEKWAPGDVASYTTLYWDLEKTYEEVEKLYDSFRGDGAMAQWSKIIIADRIGVDPVSEVLPQLTGRVTLLSQILKPITAASTAQLLAVELHDGKQFQPTLEKIVERVSQLAGDLAPEKKALGNTTYYRVHVPEPRGHQEGDPLPEPTFGIVHGYLMVTDREALLRNIILENATTALADELDFKLIANKATRTVGESKPGMLSFSRPEEGLRYLYDLAAAEQTRQRLAAAGERNQFFRSLEGVLDRNPLPPFAVLERYVAPSGAAMTNDDTGLHYVSFSLRRK